jgi:phosphomannomutase
MQFDGLMVSVSGVRGRIGEALTPEVAATFAAAFGAWALSGARARHGAAAPIVVGRDSRVSGPMLHRAVLAALESVGADIIDIGVVPTPTVQLAVEHHHAAGGLAITASHNPVEWNALKFIGPGGLFLEAHEGEAMRRLLDGPIPRAGWDALGTIRLDAAAIDRHLDQVLALPYVDVAAIRARQFVVALDCVRGAGGRIMPALLERLGCTVHAIHLEPDGRFPREPEPTADHLGELSALVQRTGAVIGLATDPDVDRLALVDERGTAIGEDYTLSLATRLVLRHRRGPVVSNLSTSQVVEDEARAAGVPFHRAPVGEVNVAVRMREVGAVIGGEGNGGVILPELHLGRDAPVGVALVLQLLAETGASVSALVAERPRYAIVKDKLDRPRASLAAVYDALRTGFADASADQQDGLRLSWPDRWVHVRPSGTEPIVRVIAEAPTAGEARALIDAARRPLAALAAA